MTPPPPVPCRECGALVPPGGACVEHFHALLALERTLGPLPPGTGEAAHFHAVATYVLQHPASMRYTREALEGARSALGDHLQGRVTLAALRARVRRSADGAARVTRREGDPVVAPVLTTWPVTVTDVLAGGKDEYVQRVARWARTTLSALDSTDPRPIAPAPGTPAPLQSAGDDPTGRARALRLHRDGGAALPGAQPRPARRPRGG